MAPDALSRPVNAASLPPLGAEVFEFVPEDYFCTQNPGALFPGMPEDAPLEVDLGCGDGAFLVESARRAPERRFLGVERLLGRVRRTCRRLARAAGESGAPAGCMNARVIRVESQYLLRYLLPPGSVRVLHLLFPDPWPKRRHREKRLFQNAFLEDAFIALEAGGEVRLATDNLPYFEQACATGCAHAGFEREAWEPGGDAPRTDFERRFRGMGLPIYRVLFRKRPDGVPGFPQ